MCEHPFLIAMKKEKKQKLNGLDIYVIFSLSVLLIFTVAEFITSTITGMEKPSLITAVFSVWGGEILSCALIKIFKLKEENSNEEIKTNDDEGAVG